MSAIVRSLVKRSTRAESARFYRPELDLLRLLAFSMVFLCHILPSNALASSPRLNTLVSALRGGLQLFFLLSAYLIAELLLREKEKTGTVRLRAFYARRVLRIWPLYFLVLISAVLFGRWTGFAVPAFLAYALLVGNWFTYAHGFFYGVGSLGALWSISIEEQFYLVWPTMVRLGGQRMLYAMSILFLVSAYFTLALLGFTHAPPFRPWTHSLVEFQFFAWGTLIALLLHKRNFVPAPLGRAALGMVALRSLAWFADLEPGVHAHDLMLAYLALSLGVVAIFFCFYGLHVPKACSPVLYLGRISFGLYIFHRPCMELARHLLSSLGPVSLLPHLVLALSLTIVAAALSYRFIETPFLRLKERFAFVKTRVA